MFFKKLRQVSQDFDRRRAEMMFNALDILPLRFGVEAEEGKKPRKGGVPILYLARDFPALVREHEAAIFFVFQITGFRELLDHAGHRCLLHFQ